MLIDEDSIERAEKAGKLIDAEDFSAALVEYLVLYAKGHFEFAEVIGWIYRRKPNKNLDLAISYYIAAAENGSAYAKHALGGIYMEIGDHTKAIEWYLKAVESGRTECLQLIYNSYKSRGMKEEAERYLVLSARSGNPYGVRDTAYTLLAGQNGISGLLRGLIMYIKNIPHLLDAARQDIITYEKNKDIR